MTVTYRTGPQLRSIEVDVSVALASGGTSTTTSQAAWGPRLEQPLDLNGDGRQLVLLRIERGNSAVPQLFAYRRGRLQHLAVAQDTPPLTKTIDANGLVLRWWSDKQVRLFSARSTHPLGRTSALRVEVYQWTVQQTPGGAPLLAATKLPGTPCYDLVGGGLVADC